MLFKKLISNKGQISMEMGILIAAAILVAVIAAYYYIGNVNETGKTTSESISSVSNTMKNGIQTYTQEINNIIDNDVNNTPTTNNSGNPYNMGVDIPPNNLYK